MVVIGGGGTVVGLAVGWNTATTRGTDGDPVVYDTPELLAGVVLVSLGGAVLFTGLFGFTHRLIADSTAEGVASGTGPRESAPGRGSSHRQRGTDRGPRDVYSGERVDDSGEGDCQTPVRRRAGV